MDVSTCRNLIENLLSSYVDGELDDHSAHSLELHMQVCPPCAAFLRTFLAAKRVARRDLVANMPDQCEASLWAFLERELGPELATQPNSQHQPTVEEGGCAKGRDVALPRREPVR